MVILRQGRSGRFRGSQGTREMKKPGNEARLEAEMTRRTAVHRCVLVLVAIATFSSGPSVEAQQAAAPPAPMVKENATVKVAAHTFVIPDMNVGAVPNVGIVVGARGTLVIDTGLGQKNGETVVREVQKVSKNADLYLVTTHFHPEHDLGASAFPPSTRMIRSRDQQKDIDEFGL